MGGAECSDVLFIAPHNECSGEKHRKAIMMTAIYGKGPSGVGSVLAPGVILLGRVNEEAVGG